MPRTGRGRVYRQPGSDVWWLDYSVRGERFRESSGSTLKSEAEAQLDKRRGEIGLGTFVGPQAEKVTLGELADSLRAHYRIKRLRTADRMGQAVKHLLDFFTADTRARNVTDERVTAYVLHRQDAGAAQATVKRELAALSKMYTLAKKRLGGYRPEIPSIDVSDNVRTGFLDGEELEAVIAELTPAVRPVVRFGAFTGWRRGEILSLRWAQVDFAAGVIRLWAGTTKNKQGRTFPFGELPPLVTLLEAQRAYTREVEREGNIIVSHVFHRGGEPIKDIRNGWNAACRRAGFPGALFHDLRRTAARRLVRAGVPEKVAMSILGHRTRSIFDRYNIVNDADQRAGIGKLAQHLAGTSAEPRKVLPINREA